jgi:hypothetical protein
MKRQLKGYQPKESFYEANLTNRGKSLTKEKDLTSKMRANK